MRLVHLSDLHLGYRQYQRLTPGGINQREADVAAIVRAAIDASIELAPDVVLIAGDVFHTVRPTNPAILHAFVQFARLCARCRIPTIVMIAGNHDTPRSTETGGILRLFAPLGIHVVDREARRLSFPDRDLSSSRFRTYRWYPSRELRRIRRALQRAGAARRGAGRATGRHRARRSRGDRDLAGRLGSVALGLRRAGPLPRLSRGRAERVSTAGRSTTRASNTWGEMDEERDARPEGQGLHRARSRQRASTRSTRFPWRVRSSIFRRSTRGHDGRPRSTSDSRRGRRVAGRHRRQDRAAPRARHAAPHRRVSSITRRSASTSAARCTSISTLRAPEIAAAARERRAGTPSVAQRHRARQAARAPARRRRRSRRARRARARLPRRSAGAARRALGRARRSRCGSTAFASAISASTSIPTSTSTPGSRASSARTAPASRRSSRRSRGRCMASRGARNARHDSLATRRRRARRSRSSWTSSWADIAIASRADSRTPSCISTAPTVADRERRSPA